MMERDRLNERPIFLRSHLLLLAVSASVLHLYQDYDRILLRFPRFNELGSRASDSEPAVTIILKELGQRLFGVLRIAGPLTVLNFFLYFFFRQFAWNWSLWIARLNWDIPRSAEPSVIPPYHYTLIAKAFFTGFLLMALWEVTNLAFTAYVSQPPLKNGNPLTSDSRDPNGSLINGLRSKKPLVKVRSS
jgi:nucleoporin NDC1